MIGVSSDMNVHFRLRAVRCQSVLGRGTRSCAWEKYGFPPLSWQSQVTQLQGAHILNQVTQLQGLTFQQVRHYLILRMQFLEN